MQGIYTLVTALWAIVDIHSFMMITGPKTDIWLVKTVAAILIPIGLFLLLNIYRTGPLLHLLSIALLSAVALALIDFYYTAKGTISGIYLADGVLQVGFILCWIYIWHSHRNDDSMKP